MATPPTNPKGSVAEHIRKLRPLIAAENARWELKTREDENAASRLKKTEESLKSLQPEINALCDAALHELIAGTLGTTLATIDMQTRLGIFDYVNTSSAKAQSSRDDIAKEDRGATTNTVGKTQDQVEQLPDTTAQTPNIPEQTSEQPSITSSFTRRVEVLEQSMNSLREDVNEIRADINEMLVLMRGMARVNISTPRGT